MEIGLMVEPQMGGGYDHLVGLARWAEDHGLDTFARSDHYLDMTETRPVTDALTALGGLARETTTIRLAVLVTPLTFRHPAVIAKAAATLDEMAHGRFELGVGTGWMEGEHEAFGLPLPSLGERFDRFEETLGYLWAAFGRSPAGFSGAYYSLADIDVKPTVDERVALIIGGSGMKRTPQLAGRFADEYNMFVTDEATLARRLAVMREAATAAGRDPERIKVSMMVNPIVGEDESEYRSRLAETAARRGVDPDRLRSRYDERGIPLGTSDEVAARFADIASWGIGRIYLQQFDPLTDIDLRNVALAVAALREL